MEQTQRDHTSKSRNRNGDFAWLRPLVQWGFLVLVLMIGVEFMLFVRQLERGMEPTVVRPPGVGAFLPISGLLSLNYWILTGVFSRIQPSGLVLLLIICSTALLLKRGFCSWVCPFGLLSDYLEKIHKFVLRRRLALPRFLDYPLRSLKYVVLLYFVWSIFVLMDVAQIERFIYSPYHRIADIKMLKFFAEPSTAKAVTIAVLTGLSLLIPYFWCRYLCPYGGLLGVLSVVSPFKIRRNRQTCTGCERCARVCPARIRVHKVGTVYSDECHACLRCVDVCPVDRALSLSAPKRRLAVPKPAYAAAIILLFVLGTFTARVSGYWQNAISTREYRHHILRLHHPQYIHHQGTVPDYDLGEMRMHDFAIPARGMPPMHSLESRPMPRSNKGLPPG